jgi:hypothetical protein
MALANDDDVINFPSHRADQPLRISVLPRRPRRDRSVANAYGPDAPDEGSSETLGMCWNCTSDQFCAYEQPRERWLPVMSAVQLACSRVV